MDEDLITNKNNTNYTDDVKVSYTFLQSIYGYSARITMIWEMIAKLFGIKEYQAMDYETVQNGPIMSWLVDRQIEWIRGEDVNFSEVYRALLTAGEFVSSEKRMFELGKIEEKLWAIYLLVSNPELDLKTI